MATDSDVHCPLMQVANHIKITRKPFFPGNVSCAVCPSIAAKNIFI